MKKLRSTTHNLSGQTGVDDIRTRHKLQIQNLKIPCHYTTLLGKIPSLDANCHLNGQKQIPQS